MERFHNNSKYFKCPKHSNYLREKQINVEEFYNITQIQNIKFPINDIAPPQKIFRLDTNCRQLKDLQNKKFSDAPPPRYMMVMVRVMVMVMVMVIKMRMLMISKVPRPRPRVE